MATATIFKVGGKGKKQCPGCSNFVGAVIKQCGCGHEFFRSDRPVPSIDSNKIVTYDIAGRGRKQCQGCEKYIGIRLSECACGGKIFASTKKVVDGDAEVQTYGEGGRGRKQCGKCQQYVGNRITVCACGSTDFPRVAPVVGEPKQAVFYPVGGPGKKQCESCRGFIAARYAKCPCGSAVFVKNQTVVVKEVKAYDVSGPGRKQCEGCQKFVAARVLTCVCGTVFPDTVAAPEKPVRVEKSKYHDITSSPYFVPPSPYTLGLKTRIIAAAGPCPFKLTGTDEETIKEWAQSVIDHGVDRNVEYTLRALIAYAITFYTAHTDEGKGVMRTLKDLEPVLYRHISEFSDSGELYTDE